MPALCCLQAGSSLNLQPPLQSFRKPSLSRAAARLPLPTSTRPGHSLHHSPGFHGAQGVIHSDQVTATFVTGRDIEAAEGEAQCGVSVPPQGPLAAGVRRVGAVREAGRGEAGRLAATGVQGKAAAVCVGQEDMGQSGAGPRGEQPGPPPEVERQPGLAPRRRPRLLWTRERLGRGLLMARERQRDVLAITTM